MHATVASPAQLSAAAYALDTRTAITSGAVARLVLRHRAATLRGAACAAARAMCAGLAPIELVRLVVRAAPVRRVVAAVRAAAQRAVVVVRRAAYPAVVAVCATVVTLAACAALAPLLATAAAVRAALGL